ncbi:CarboxypepD_reg-like domain-containing protein [Bacteroides luti]|uniref:CarboxypepD_reg-like domain-containing protein n=1 Tax=Bacteroides luti TaxID=1297750 RepID=A0A1M4UET7_9BACE|nr:carboxypeptidase-like regulatory domain-containing protein [Bacteroides luti]SHE55289.1 CarboxypepD_reg-like domain-containing protein [Bacteroides luti]
MKRSINLIILIIFPIITFAQTYSGNVLNEKKEPLEFVNIGIVGKDIGTVSDVNGHYNINVGSEFDNDSIRFSYTGYTPVSIKMADFKKQPHLISLKPQVFNLSEVVIKPIRVKEKKLGNNFKVFFQAGFMDNKKGYEMGVLLKIKKRAILHNVSIKVTKCTYDSLCFRLNVYKEAGKNNFVNVLRDPIYIYSKAPKGSFTLSSKLTDNKLDNIVVEGNTLVTMEFIKDLGKGQLYLASGMNRIHILLQKNKSGKMEKSTSKTSLKC